MNKTILVMLAALFLTPAHADGHGLATLAGRTYGEWSAQWWLWVRGIPASQNPLLWGSGEFECNVGAQPEQIIFLAGTLGGVEPVVRTCSAPIPSGKIFFLSPLNLMWNNTPADPPYTEADKRLILEGLLSDGDEHPDYSFDVHACNLGVSVDGKSVVQRGVPLVRTQSPAFRFRAGADDISGNTEGVTDEKSVADGYWVALLLSRGPHTVRLTGDICDQTHQPVDGFHQDYTYVLRVR